jgi:transposase
MMRLDTFVSKYFKHSGYVISDIEVIDGTSNDENPERINIHLRDDERKNGKCSKCGEEGTCYDHLPVREFQHVPLWGSQTYIIYRPRRINCSKCGPIVEKIPWAEGKARTTTEFAWHLSEKTKDTSYK